MKAGCLCPPALHPVLHGIDTIPGPYINIERLMARRPEIFLLMLAKLLRTNVVYSILGKHDGNILTFHKTHKRSER